MSLILESERHGNEKFGPEEIARDLPLAIKWYSSLGINYEISTLKKAKENYEEVEDMYARGQEIFLKYINNTRKIKEIFHGLENIRSYIRIYRALSKINQSEMPKNKLKEIMVMPFLPDDEEIGDPNVHPRNTLFELEMASRIIESGFKFNGFNDIDFQVNETRIVAECKRIHSIKRIKANCDKALQQIHDGFKNSSDRGLAIISYDKTANIEDRIFTVDNQQQLDARGNQLLLEFYGRNRIHFDMFHNARVFGILLIIKFNYVFNHEGLLNPYYKVSIIKPFPKDLRYAYEENIYRTFFDKFKT